MVETLRSLSFLSSCILAGVGVVFLFLALFLVLPPTQAFGLIGGSALVTGLVLARLRREAAESGPAVRVGAGG